MCIRPLRMNLPGGRVQSVWCRKCKQCKDARIRDLTGRCIAERQTCVGAHMVTLTYADLAPGVKPVEAESLTYKDVQKWMKRLRKAGYPLRYFLAGEYGEQKGRAHWHVLTFWQERIPEWQIGNNWNDPFWSPYAYGGHINVAEFNVASVGYVAQYLNNDDPESGVEAEQHMSTKPPLGFEYFMRLADDYVAQQLIPRDCEYSFADIVNRHGEPRKFEMMGATRDAFCERFIGLWQRAYGEHPLSRSFSELLADYEDSKAARGASPVLERRRYVHRPWIGTGIFIDGDEVKPSFDDKRNAWYYVDLHGQVWWWSFNADGERAWASEIVTEGNALRRRETLRASWAASAPRKLLGRSARR